MYRPGFYYTNESSGTSTHNTSVLLFVITQPKQANKTIALLFCLMPKCGLRVCCSRTSVEIVMTTKMATNAFVCRLASFGAAVRMCWPNQLRHSSRCCTCHSINTRKNDCRLGRAQMSNRKIPPKLYEYEIHPLETNYKRYTPFSSAAPEFSAL